MSVVKVVDVAGDVSAVEIVDVAGEMSVVEVIGVAGVCLWLSLWRWLGM